MKKLGYTLLWTAMIAAALASILSLAVNTDSRYLKFLDFPRIQLFWAGFGVLILFFLVNRRWAWYDYVISVGLALGIGIQATYLVNYTSLVDEEVPDVSAESDETDGVSVLLVNVKQDNRSADALVQLIGERQPDLVLAMETNAWWDEALQPVEDAYPYGEEVINDVTYGMVLYSQLPLSEVRVERVTNPQVPSIAATITLEDGRRFRFLGVHPVPPTNFKKLPDNEGEREVALSIFGRRAAEAELPVLLAGDFNDVAWGDTDRLTETEDVLHDVRVGRGFYNSFDADNFLMRWPLDHALVSNDWSVVGIERLGDVGSDHYPILVELALER